MYCIIFISGLTLLCDQSALYLLSSSSALRSVVEGNLAVVKLKNNFKR